MFTYTLVQYKIKRNIENIAASDPHTGTLSVYVCKYSTLPDNVYYIHVTWGKAHQNS